MWQKDIDINEVREIRTRTSVFFGCGAINKINDIAKDLGFSKSTLTRRLKSLIDKSPIEILSEFRLHKAKSLLSEGKMSVSEIAYEVGFNDPSYFSRKYKDYFGTSPSK